MRLRTTLGVLAIGGAMLTSTACLPGLTSSAEQKTACANMLRELQAIPSKVSQNLTNPTAAAQVYDDAAGTLRSEGQKAGGDVQTAAEKVANDLEDLGQTLRDAGNGNPSIPDTSKITSSGAELERACNN
ncbi:MULTISPECIES: hypothetical protein [Thermomonospora]|uniref:Small secreted protein n=1 Tax=Thermomonospora cellulosilytica TaxID=1411118 RepID=A0A7W3MV11_9ACTN|nr:MULTISPECIES: hypothetical protein [Thermomonospora]MBA9002389.1 hypothetical protein [Thermomonospora cellulosilytica]